MNTPKKKEYITERFIHVFSIMFLGNLLLMFFNLPDGEIFSMSFIYGNALLLAALGTFAFYASFWLYEVATYKPKNSGW